jgi:hypothetical protein
MDGRCCGTNSDGSRCSARPLPGRGWCHWHDPDREELRRESRRRGGRNSSREARARRLIAAGLESLGDFSGLMSIAVFDAYRGKLDPGVLTAMATGVRVIKDLSIAAEYGEQVVELREEIARLRQERAG